MEELFAPELRPGSGTERAGRRQRDPQGSIRRAPAARRSEVMHPRLSVNTICSMNQSFEEDLALWAELGIDNVGLISPKLEAVGWDNGRQAVLDAGLTVSSMSCYRDGIAASMEFAASVGTAGALHRRRQRRLDPLGGGRREVLRGAGAARGAGARSSVCVLVGRADQSAAHRRELRALRPRRHRSRPHGRHGRHGRLLFVPGTSGDSTSSSASTSTWWRWSRSATTSSAPSTCRTAAPSATGTSRWSGSWDRSLEAGYEGPFDLEILGPRIEEEGYRGPDRSGASSGRAPCSSALGA